MILRYFIEPGLSLLPAKMDTIEASVMLTAIGLQESRFEHRFQVGGPAHGFWQFEKGGGVQGVLSHITTIDIIRHICKLLRVEPSVTKCFDAITYNDTLACIFARLLLWTLPYSLPKIGEEKKAWEQYLDAWRPGKPREESWSNFYWKACEMVKNG
jgi:hypothetical protein